MFNQLQSTYLKIEDSNCICKNIHTKDTSFVASLQFNNHIIVFPDTMTHLGCDVKNDINEQILGATGYSNVRKLDVQIMEGVIVSRISTVLKFKSMANDVEYTYSTQSIKDPITYVNELRTTGEI